MKEGRRGFTLTELLVVIAIIALLSSVVLVSLSTARMKSRDARRIEDLRQIAIAISMYADDRGMFPLPLGCTYNIAWCYANSYNAATWPNLQTQLSPYIAKLPIDPINSPCGPYSVTPCYSYAYGNVGNGKVEGTNTDGVHLYDLVARLETPDHPLACKFQKYTAGFVKTSIWCPTSDRYQMYDGSLD